MTPPLPRTLRWRVCVVNLAAMVAERALFAADRAARLLAPSKADGEREIRERVAAAIEAERSARWQKHLTEHPHATANSCAVILTRDFVGGAP